jgi:predicted kinase
VEAVFFDTPIEVCQERNRLRERVVPQDVIERMARKMTPPSREEGFSRVTVVRE